MQRNIPVLFKALALSKDDLFTSTNTRLGLRPLQYVFLCIAVYWHFGEDIDLSSGA
jgi:hypothetical protein